MGRWCLWGGSGSLQPCLPVTLWDQGKQIFAAGSDKQQVCWFRLQTSAYQLWLYLKDGDELALKPRHGRPDGTPNTGFYRSLKYGKHGPHRPFASASSLGLRVKAPPGSRGGGTLLPQPAKLGLGLTLLFLGWRRRLLGGFGLHMLHVLPRMAT